MRGVPGLLKRGSTAALSKAIAEKVHSRSRHAKVNWRDTCPGLARNEVSHPPNLNLQTFLSRIFDVSTALTSFASSSTYAFTAGALSFASLSTEMYLVREAWLCPGAGGVLIQTGAQAQTIAEKGQPCSHAGAPYACR